MHNFWNLCTVDCKKKKKREHVWTQFNTVSPSVWSSRQQSQILCLFSLTYRVNNAQLLLFLLQSVNKYWTFETAQTATCLTLQANWKTQCGLYIISLPLPGLEARFKALSFWYKKVVFLTFLSRDIWKTCQSVHILTKIYNDYIGQYLSTCPA